MDILIKIPQSIVDFCIEKNIGLVKRKKLIKSYIETKLLQDDWGIAKDDFERWLEENE
jgi:hypothetical protein